MIGETAIVVVALFDEGGADTSETLAVDTGATLFAIIIFVLKNGHPTVGESVYKVAALAVEILDSRFFRWSRAIL